ncbi:MAG: hypothetical protein LBH19_08410 [Dysgonamonadaceae bacterium]|jgi:hypothetical protein|nr:hypothetical protein [Dysgonamonadaceae bacterium]
MRTVNLKCLKQFILFLSAAFFLNACSHSEDSRIYEPAQIVAVYVNGEMVGSNRLLTDPQQTTVTLDPGTDLTRLKVRVTTINGEPVDFPNDVERDYTQPVDVKIHSYNGPDVTVKFHIISRPLLVDFYIEGISIPQENIHFGVSSIIAQVPEKTNVTALKVTMGFKNGTVSGFTNGTAVNYTQPVDFQVTGVDGTVYPYQLIITDQPVGPASIRSLTANTAEAANLEIDANGNVQVYFKTLTNFASAALTIQSGFGNEFVDFTNGTAVNLWTSPKVKIKGSDGVIKEFTFKAPKQSLTETCRKTPAEMEFGADGGASLCFSGNYIVASTHNGTAGIHYYDLAGKKVGTMVLPADVNMGNAITGLRKIASDDKGAIIAVNLAAGGAVGTAYHIYKWNNVTDANPVVLCSFTASELGLTATRTNGINVQGSLDGNAVITVPITTSKVVLKWTVQNGALVNAKPETVSLENESNFGNYSSVEQYPGKATTWVGALATSNFSGLRAYLGSAPAVSVSGSTTDLRMKVIDGRVYLAHTVWSSGSAKHIFNFRDVTDDNDAAYRYNMLDDNAFIATASNGNATNDADFGMIDGKWYVAYLGTNGGVVCYLLR